MRDSGTAIDSIPTPLALAPKAVKIAPPAYLREPQINSKCPILYLWVTGGRWKGKRAKANAVVTLCTGGGSPNIALISASGISKSINSAFPIYSNA